MRQFIALLIVASALRLGAGDSQLLRDTGFEDMPVGRLAATGTRTGWEIQQHGRSVIQDRLRVACVENATQARSGAKCLSLSIPQDTVGFEFVTVGQRVWLAPDKEYEASAWVRWPGGPDRVPANATATSGHSSAIVSFWARHRDGTGDFAGRDVWLFDNRWKHLSFRFRATDPAQRTLVYVSLLPNQRPAETTILLDDFELVETRAQSRTDSRTNLVGDANFDRQTPGAIAPPWNFANLGGSSISGRVAAADGQRYITLVMDKATSSFESAQLWQHLNLREGARYAVTCRMRWDNFSPKDPPPIVNYGIYHEMSRTWYGPVDQALEKTGDWRTYRFAHAPPFDGQWKLYVQLNGWGNFGRPVTVSFDNFTCVPSQLTAHEW